MWELSLIHIFAVVLDGEPLLADQINRDGVGHIREGDDGRQTKSRLRQMPFSTSRPSSAPSRIRTPRRATPRRTPDHRAQQRAEKAPDVGGDRLSVPVELIVIGHADELGS